MLVAGCMQLGAQNLVPNPSFEDTTNCCPNDISMMHCCSNWYNCGPLSTADFFYRCPMMPLVPSNPLGFQYPATGNGYSGIFCYCGYYDRNYREYISSQLITPLLANQKYYISFKVSRSDDTLTIGASSNKIGARFTNSLCIYDSLAPNNIAHFYSNAIITDTHNWTLISGSFISDSSYQYIVLGNFFNDSSTNTFGAYPFYSYYYIDDVCVSLDSMSCFQTESTYDQLEVFVPNVFTPNNDGQNDLFKWTVKGSPKMEMAIYNRWGELVFRTQNPSDYWDGNIMGTTLNASDGTYYYYLSLLDYENERTTQKGFITLLRH